jgi:crotonobetainyl-CoA:carnitine CoA-transferase CaiB-like acyl-CoA transferase
MEDPHEGTIVTTAIPVDFSESPGTLRSMAPNLGEHTQVILAEAGLSQAEIAATAEPSTAASQRST